MKLPWLTPALQPVPNLPGTRFSAWPQASAPFSCPGLPTAKSSIPWRHRSVKGDSWAHQKNWLVGGWTNSCEKYYIVVVKCSICRNQVENTKYITIFEKHSIYTVRWCTNHNRIIPRNGAALTWLWLGVTRHDWHITVDHPSAQTGHLIHD